MSRLENGIIQIKRENKNLHHTLTAAVSQIVPSAAEKEIELHVECEERLMLNHDRKWTEEAIFNVLDNAVKYTKSRREGSCEGSSAGDFYENQYSG